MIRSHRLWAVVSLALVTTLAAPGCDLTRFTANSTANMFSRASAGLEQHFDYELVGDALPGNILQLEGVFRIIPDNEQLGITLVRAYTAYGFGWVEDELQRAQDQGDLDEEERLMGRARLLYTRGRNIGLHLMRLRDPGIDAALEGGHEGFVEYIEQNYTSAEDVPVLFWTGYAWGSAINAGRDDPEMVLMLPFARALVERAVELDESYYNYSGLTFLGVVNASLPEALGGNPEAARDYFERALEATNRNFYTVHVSYARTYAVGQQDRDLYINLLREVVDGGDPVSEARLTNRMARRRAIRWLERTDQLF
ncbi:MAG: TRAP transporter TatT component family protein [Myxococcota bacterium]|nr:TRAP transporter TatT component family protein [Myxococcota bacterium]